VNAHEADAHRTGFFGHSSPGVHAYITDVSKGIFGPKTKAMDTHLLGTSFS
jgi:hypothetical protein